GMQGRISYSIQHAGDTLTKQRLTNSPRHILHFTASFPLISQLRATAEMKYESARRTVQAATTRDYLLINLNLVTKSSFHKHLELSFLINNLFDVNYQTPGGLEHKQPAIRQNGRNFILGAGYTF
ncbi:TonB-dependent receptor, partial [bacterium]|nr:TonB-dependent receptor [bacterium]